MQQSESAASDGQPSSAAGPVTVVRPRQRIEIKRKEETPPSVQPPSGPTCTLHIHLPRTENYIDDLRCMQEVARHLQQFRGDHKVRLYLPKEHVCVVLEPMERINPTQELLTRLAGLLGESSVQVEQAA